MQPQGGGSQLGQSKVPGVHLRGHPDVPAGEKKTSPAFTGIKAEQGAKSTNKGLGSYCS